MHIIISCQLTEIRNLVAIISAPYCRFSISFAISPAFCRSLPCSHFKYNVRKKGVLRI